MAAPDEMCHVSIRTAGHELDVTLPVHLPIAELMPTVVELLGTIDFEGCEPHLASVAGQVLDPSATLAQCAISDGELLTLVAAATPPVRTALFDVSTGVIASVTALPRRSAPADGGRARRCVAGWAAVLLVMVLGCPMLSPDAGRHPLIGAAAVVLALARAVAVRRDRTAAVFVGLLAVAIAGPTAALLYSGPPGLPNVLLALSAAGATALITWRLLDCAPAVFLSTAATAMTAAATATGAVAGWWPAAAAGPLMAVASIVVLTMAARAAVYTSGLSTTPGDLDVDAGTRTAHRRLTMLIVTAAGLAAVGAAITAATTQRPVTASCLIAATGAALALRAFSQRDIYCVAALLISCLVSASAVIALCAIAVPSSSPWLCAGLLAVAAGALCRQPGRWAAKRRLISALDLVVGSAVIPAAAAAAGAFAALPGLGLR